MLVYGKCECFVMQILYGCVLCASSVLRSAWVAVVNADRGCKNRPYGMAANDTEYKRCTCHGGYKLRCKLCRNLRPQQCPINRFCKPAMWTAGWLALFRIKAGDVETNPGPVTTHKQFWIFDICHKQIHCMKHISIRCNRIEPWLHLRYAGIRLAQYTYT